MLVLAFDVSSSLGSVAVLDGSQVLARLALDPEKRSAQTLAPAIADALTQAEGRPTQIGLIATTIGPGSFTGLRVGVTMAKTLAYALQCDLIGLNTLDVIAAQIPVEMLASHTVEIHAVLDAQRKELFAGRYQFEADHDRLRRLDDGLTILSAQTWCQTLRAGDFVTGSGLARWQDQLPVGVTEVPCEFHAPDATTIGRLAAHDHQQGRRDDLWTFSPLYIRPSYAEEKK